MGLDTWNPWHGCHRCSPGCEHCYMYFMDAKRERPEWSDKIFRTGKFDLPLKKNRDKTYKIKAGQRIRVNMTSDTFLSEATEWMPEFWSIIRRRPDVIFWLLTKRPENILPMLPEDWGDGYKNVMLNVTMENQDMADRRWEIFKKIPAAHKGLCIAPMIGPVNLEPILATGEIQEVACGGENYDGPRPCAYEWVVALSQQCEKYETNFCWYESGTRLIRNGRCELWFKKSDQGAVAYFSGLNRKFYDIEFELYDPEDEHKLVPEELWQKRYNKNHCMFCANRMLCNGCLQCGDCCQPPEMISRDELWMSEDELLQSGVCILPALSGTGSDLLRYDWKWEQQ